MGGFKWAEEIKAYRKARSWNQTGFANATGITQCQVSRIEDGQIPKRSTILKIIKIEEFRIRFALFLLRKYINNTYK